MKKILLITMLVNSFMVMSQNIVYHGYKSIPFSSDVWRVEYKGTGDSLTGVIYPKNGKYFKMNFIPVRDKIDKDNIEHYKKINDNAIDPSLTSRLESMAMRHKKYTRRFWICRCNMKRFRVQRK
jgi:hypothetical protein